MEKLKLYMDKYEERFADAFPTFCFMHLSPEEMTEVIDECLHTGKDVYELGILTDDHDVKY